MTYSTFNFKFSDLDIDLKQIENVLGYTEGDDRDIVNALIDQVLEEQDLFSNIKAEYKIFDNIEFIDRDKSLGIGNVNFEIHKVITRQLRNSDSIAVILCTAGEEIGTRTRNAMAEGDPLTGYIYDIFGSMVVDATADMVQSILEKTVLTRGKKITNRYSPGYCGWSVAEQHKLFSIMPENYCGIKLTDSALMSPEKSISCIIGIGEDVSFNAYTCSLCDMKDCSFREVKPRQT
jgi:hypothetical protein